MHRCVARKTSAAAADHAGHPVVRLGRPLRGDRGVRRPPAVPTRRALVLPERDPPAHRPGFHEPGRLRGGPGPRRGVGPAAPPAPVRREAGVQHRTLLLRGLSRAHRLPGRPRSSRSRRALGLGRRLQRHHAHRPGVRTHDLCRHLALRPTARPSSHGAGAGRWSPRRDHQHEPGAPGRDRARCERRRRVAARRGGGDSLPRLPHLQLAHPELRAHGAALRLHARSVVRCRPSR